MEKTNRPSLIVIAAAVIIAGLIYFKDLLTSLALAIFIWLMIEAFAREFNRRIPFLPSFIAYASALTFILCGFVALIIIIADNAADMAANRQIYFEKINVLLALLPLSETQTDPLRLETIIAGLDSRSILQSMAEAAQGLLSDLLLVLIYVFFLFGAKRGFDRKMHNIFGQETERELASDMLSQIQTAMERYLWIQTLLSLIITLLTYTTLVALGLDNPLFWAMLIFVLNYIPTVGSILAVLFPTLFALVQFDEWWRIALVAGGVGFWQFSIGNFLQPRMMGVSLNQSAIIVLISLAFWGSIWGITGAFLSTPLTVMVMIILAQFDSTRWVAILLSDDGNPGESTKLPMLQLRASKSASGSRR